MSQMKLSIGSVVVHQPSGGRQNPNALRRSLEANLVRELASIHVGSAREANVVRARMPASRAKSNMGAAISQAITQAIGKAR